MWLGEGYEVRSVHRNKEGSDVSGIPNPDIQAASVRVLPHPIFFWNRAGSGKTPQDPVGPMPFAMQTEYELEEHHEGYWEFRRKHFQNHQMSLGRNGPSSLF